MEKFQFRVISRHSLPESEKCPRCLNVFQNFMDLGRGLMGCFKCGSVFVSRTVRDFNYGRIVEQMLLQDLEAREVDKKPPTEIRKDDPDPIFTCSCGKVCKSKAGLVAHQRKCNGGNTGVG